MHPQPNILFITCHDLGRHLGCYGRNSVRSEALDSLARQGVLFDNSFCTAPQCSPSRASLYTGRYPHRVGMLGLAHEPFNWHLDPAHRPIARRLREAGYHTTLLGVQHVTHDAQVHALGYDAVFPVAPAPELAQKARRLIANQVGEKRPFYLEIGFFEPHRPYDWGGAVPDDARGVQLPPYIPAGPAAVADFAALQGSIRALDRAVGAILAALDDHALADNTLVIFTTDHGLAMPRAKGTLYDPGLNTALLLRWPAQGIRGGRRIADLISHVDLLPTLLDALGLPLPHDLDGNSFWPLLKGRPYKPNREIFAAKTFHTAYEPLRAIRTRRHKLILNFETGLRYDVPGDIQQSPIYPLLLDRLAGERDQVELYDLEQDPGETYNLANNPAAAELKRDLLDRLNQWMLRTEDPLRGGPAASPFYAAALQLLSDV